MNFVVAKDKEKSPTAIAFGKRLHALREAKGMTQEALGAAAGKMLASSIARLEAGARTPSWETVLALATALGVTPDAFTEAAATPPPKQPKPKK